MICAVKLRSSCLAHSDRAARRSAGRRRSSLLTVSAMPTAYNNLIPSCYSDILSISKRYTNGDTMARGTSKLTYARIVRLAARQQRGEMTPTRTEIALRKSRDSGHGNQQPAAASTSVARLTDVLNVQPREAVNRGVSVRTKRPSTDKRTIRRRSGVQTEADLRQVTASVAFRQDKRRVMEEIKITRGCTDCGYRSHPQALVFDHLPGFKKLGTVADFCASGSMPQMLAEMEKCEVVCANCHAIRTANRRLGVTVDSAGEGG